MKTLIALVLLGTACSSARPVVMESLRARGDDAHPLFVGTSVDGETLVAATHYDAVNGLAVRTEDLALRGDEQLTCIREMRTGTHVPAWYCRFDKDAADRRAATQFAMASPGRATVPILGATGNRNRKTF